MADKPDLIDIGVNLTHKRFDRDRDEVIGRAQEAGVTMMVLTGVDLPGSEAASELARQHPGMMRSTAGVHPHHAKDWNSDMANAIRALAEQKGVVAIGETGLDFNRNFSTPADQEHAFAQQLELAAELQLPVFLHQRDADERFAAILREYRGHLVDAVVHCFTDGQHVLWPFLDLDCHIGVTGWICDDRRGTDLRACVKDIPVERLLVETDAPFLTPKDLDPKPRDGRNEPAFLPHVVQTVARYRGETPEAVAAATTTNARRFFRV